MPEIVVMHAAREVARVQVTAGELSIGRDAGNGIVINDPRVSRTHARILLRDSAYVLEDRASTHGTFLNEVRISEKVLKDGDVIRIGDRYLTFMAKEGQAPVVRGEAPPDNREFDTWAEFQTMLMQPGTGQESARRLKALFEMSMTLETATDFKSVLNQLLDKALLIMGAERGFIMLEDPQTRSLKVHVARDKNGSISGVDAESVSGSLMKKVVETSKPVLVQNALQGEWGTESMLVNKIHSALCVPLKTREDVTGVIYVDHRSRVSAFTEQDLAFFTTFAIQAKAAIDSSRAYWELVDSLFRASEDFIVVCDKDGRILQANLGAAKLTGLTQAELATRKIEDLMTAADRADVRKLTEATLDKGVASGADLTLSGPADGKDVPMSVSSFALRDRVGKAMGICFIGRDLSEIKSLIERLTAANVKLRELNDMKSQFVGMITHELKTPLSVVVGYAEMMLQDPKDTPSPRHQDYLTRILRSGDRLIGLIMELLELTRIETGKINLNLTSVDTKALMTEIIDNFTLQAKERNVRVDLIFPDNLPLIEADKDLIRRAFDNFVSNGIKYNKPGGVLRVAAEWKGGETVFSFSDEGIGISKEDQERLFERFFRSESVHGIPGTGLGLSIVKAIVERHDGRISVDSQLGKGTTFKITLPMKAPLAEL